MNLRRQYSGDSLLEQLSDRLRNYNNDKYCLGILGVTNKDIYENDYNFLFEWARKKWGVISYVRFLLDNPSDTQFEKRSTIQALSSVGFVIDIPRCTNPNCARAYPNSLEEMDRKNTELCEECKTNLRNLYLTLIDWAEARPIFNLAYPDIVNVKISASFSKPML
ncbi:MAG: hypothetical protein LBT93_08605 [Treponema sp.]|nr:hypothetical protein [Treponema sp.]